MSPPGRKRWASSIDRTSGGSRLFLRRFISSLATAATTILSSVCPRSLQSKFTRAPVCWSACGQEKPGPIIGIWLSVSTRASIMSRVFCLTPYETATLRASRLSSFTSNSLPVLFRLRNARETMSTCNSLLIGSMLRTSGSSSDERRTFNVLPGTRFCPPSSDVALQSSPWTSTLMCLTPRPFSCSVIIPSR